MQIRHVDGRHIFSLLTTASSIISPKRGTPHPINILGSSNSFEGLKLSKLCNRMGVSKIGTPNFYSLSWLILILPICAHNLGHLAILKQNSQKVRTSMVMIHRPANPQTWHDIGHLLALRVRFLPISSGLNLWNDIGCLWLDDAK